MTVDVLKGKICTSIVGAEIDSDEIIFTTSNGCRYKMYHDQDCCESVSINDITGDITNLIGEPLLVVEEATNFEEPSKPKGADESYTWTFYRFQTIKGSVTIRWFGTSNGYYSESVYFTELTKGGK